MKQIVCLCVCVCVGGEGDSKEGNIGGKKEKTGGQGRMKNRRCHAGTDGEYMNTLTSALF